ncbi:MAG: putative sensor histidine kinase [Chlamydiales bacterium]|jgi:signal transduction histidine kinase|nr:putative sensor histidine kinase [Chlamydiales bacterium]
MLSFKRKVLISYALVFLTILTFIIPFVSNSIRSIGHKAMCDRTYDLISKIASAENDFDLVNRLKNHKFQIFFRVSIITDDRRILYDSHTKRLLGHTFSQQYIVHHKEVTEAFKKGLGYHEDYSELLEQEFAYFAQAFDFHGKTYVMRTAFPYQYLADVKRDLEVGIVAVVVSILLLFSIITWAIFNHLTQPIQQIIEAIKPYQSGKTPHIPEIILKNLNPEDDFSRLAMTLNTLSQKMQSYINTLIAERNEKLAILESLIEGVIATNSQMIITYANPTSLKMLSIDLEDLLQKPIQSIRPSALRDLLEVCQQERRVITSQLEIKQGGKKLYLDVIASPKKDQSGAVLILQDKSQHRRMIEMRKDFVANASHELKTPITIIRGFAETLHDNLNLPTPVVAEITDKIVRNCERMTALIKQLLTLADVENLPKSHLVRCNLHLLLQSCKQTILEIYPATHIDIDCDVEEVLFADAGLLELALINLLTNAAKYSEEPAQVRVSVQAENSHLKICISDQGIGIPPESLEHIFQRFYSVNKQQSKKMGGSGLGLSIVQTIIDKHFGSISCQSELGLGTTFTILLPRKLQNLLD